MGLIFDPNPFNPLTTITFVVRATTPVDSDVLNASDRARSALARIDAGATAATRAEPRSRPTSPSAA